MIDTDFWNRPEVRAMKAPYKLLWSYLNCACDHAGIWVVELDVAALRLGVKLDREEALSQFGALVENYGGRWLVTTFVEDQYGTLNPANKVHASVLQRLDSLKNEGATEGLPSPLQGAKDKDKVKDMAKDKEGDGVQGKGEKETPFDEAGISPEDAKAANTALHDLSPDWKHYTDAISTYSAVKSIKRTRKGWLATYRQFINGDNQKGILKSTKPTTTAAWNPRA